MQWIERTIGGGLWGFAIVVGPIILALAIVWALTHNRRTRAERDRTERALRDRHDEDRRREGVPRG